ALLSESGASSSPLEPSPPVAGTLVPSAETDKSPLIDLLHQDPLIWRPLIAAAWSRYAGLVSVWQLQSDGPAARVADPRLPSAVAILRREMAAIMSRPVLATTSCAHDAIAAAPPAEYHSVTIDHR